MNDWNSAYRIITSPMGEFYWKSGISKFHHEKGEFIPICQYPIGVEILDGEIGAMVKLRMDQTIEKIYKRIIIS